MSLGLTISNDIGWAPVLSLFDGDCVRDTAGLKSRDRLEEKKRAGTERRGWRLQRVVVFFGGLFLGEDRGTLTPTLSQREREAEGTFASGR